MRAEDRLADVSARFFDVNPREQDVPGTITVGVEWDAALGRTAVVFVALECEGEGVDITSRMLGEVRTHWILARSALGVVTVDVGGEDVRDCDRIPVRKFLSRVLAQHEREPLEFLYARSPSIASLR